MCVCVFACMRVCEEGFFCLCTCVWDSDLCIILHCASCEWVCACLFINACIVHAVGVYAHVALGFISCIGTCVYFSVWKAVDACVCLCTHVCGLPVCVGA